MPPAAISRSSTYLPKICGNIALAHGSALWLVGLLSGCRPGPKPDRILALEVHALPGCAAEQGTIELTALGDFDASPLTAELFDSNSAARDLKFPLDTRAVSADLTAGTHHWWGVAERSGDTIDLPLWPEEDACTLYPVGQNVAYPGSAGGEAFGWSASKQVLLIAGEAIASSNAANAVAVDLRTGKAAATPKGMVPSRAYATITAFGDNLLVAGGVNPSNLEPRATASVYETATGTFDRSRLVTLSSPRAHHAALVLDSGETLLVGGIDDRGEALSTLEAVSPSDRAVRLTNLATLEVGRIDPYAIRLTDDRILVAGGHDANGKPVGTLEWLTQDARGNVAEQMAKQSAVPPRFDQAFVAMPGGAALAVGGCEDRAPDPGEDCSVCPKGCPPEGGFDAYWISPEGTAARLPVLDVAAPKPLLISASNGAPWLVASGTLLRFDPWQARFLDPPVRPSHLPNPDMPRPLALGPGVFVWLGPEALRGFRYDTRDEYAFDLLPLLSSAAPEGSFPDSPELHTAPDRSPLNGEIGLDPAGHGVRLRGGSATLRVTDTTYADLHLQIVVGAGALPLVLLGSTEIGGPNCRWPQPDQPPQADETLVVDRQGRNLTLSRKGQTRACVMPRGRVKIALRKGGDPETVVRSLLLRRQALAR